MYQEEGIIFPEFTFIDNIECVNLIEAKGGVLSLLDDMCKIGKSSTDISYLNEVTKMFGKEGIRPSSYFEKLKSPILDKNYCGFIRAVL